MNKYNVKVWYQEPLLNILGRGNCVVDRSEAVNVTELMEVGAGFEWAQVEAKDVWEACEKVWVRMNTLHIPNGHYKRPRCVQAGHTSMSVGDYIEVEGHEGIYFCAMIGFVQLKGQEIYDAEMKADAVRSTADYVERMNAHQEA